MQDRCIEEYGIENGGKKTFLKTSYNTQGEPISYKDGNGNETKIIIKNDYENALGQIVQKKIIVNPMGMLTEIEFDALGRIYSISKKDPFGVLLSSQKFLFDALGNKACETNDIIVAGKIQDSQRNLWQYGPMGRLEEEIQAAGTPLEAKTQFRYNLHGKISEKIFGSIETTLKYSYHSDGNLAAIAGKSNNKELEIAFSYAYDRGNLTLAKTHDEKKSIRRTYNPFNQISKETINDGEGSYNLEYKYDRKGRLNEVILPDLSKIVYVYDGVFGREVRRLSPTGKLLYTHAYETYDLQGKLLKENHIGYLGSQEYVYDLNGQKILSKNDIFTEGYTRDSLGQIIEVKGDYSEKYSYNALSQLISEKKIGTNTYGYDSIDNRIAINNYKLHCNSLNQLTAYTGCRIFLRSKRQSLKKGCERRRN